MGFWLLLAIQKVQRKDFIMKKILLALLCSMWAMAMTAQINPVDNLSWWQQYDSPYNYFLMEWDVPNSQDNLVGYNIYRGDVYFRFQTENYICNTDPLFGDPCQNASENFLLNNGNTPFWAHVTAVYNPNMEESGYNDSVLVQEALIGIKEMRLKTKPVLYPNPTTGKLIIAKQNIEQIILFDLNGKLVKKKIKPKPEIDLSGISKGIYFIRLFSEEGVLTEKLVVE